MKTIMLRGIDDGDGDAATGIAILFTLALFVGVACGAWGCCHNFDPKGALVGRPCVEDVDGGAP